MSRGRKGAVGFVVIGISASGVERSVGSGRGGCAPGVLFNSENAAFDPGPPLCHPFGGQAVPLAARYWEPLMRTLPPVLPLALLLASLAPLPGCHDGSSAGTAGDGVTKTDPRDVATFDAIEVDGAVKLEISSSPATELSLSGDENILPLISTTVTGGKLVIHPTVAINPKLPLVVSVHVPTLRRIDVNGAASLHVKGLRAASFTLASNGVSDAELSGQVGQLESTSPARGAFARRSSPEGGARHGQRCGERRSERDRQAQSGSLRRRCDPLPRSPEQPREKRERPRQREPALLSESRRAT